MIFFDPTGGFALPIGLRALGIEWIDLHTGFQQFALLRTLAGLDRKRNRAIGLQLFSELLPTQAECSISKSSSTLPWRSTMTTQCF
jgi:hypothetical protein